MTGSSSPTKEDRMHPACYYLLAEQYLRRDFIMIEQIPTTGASTEAQDLVERAKALLWRDVLQWEDYY